MLRYNSMFALVALGMCFVIMTGGIDLSVGATAALGSVVSAILSPLWDAGRARSAASARASSSASQRLRHRAPAHPALHRDARDDAGGQWRRAAARQDQSVSVSYESGFTDLGQGDILQHSDSGADRRRAYVIGSIVLNFTSAGRTVLAIGGNEDASRLMGLPVDRVKFFVYVVSGGLAGLAGVILASQFGAGQPIEGVGWELVAIASVVVGGTLLTGGLGSVGATLAGVMLLGLIFNVLNFENGLGFISLSAYWQSVIRGVFLLAVVILQSQLTDRADREGAP